MTTARVLPTHLVAEDEAVFEIDAWHREGRRRLLAQLEKAGQSRYLMPPGYTHEFGRRPSSARLILLQLFRTKAWHLRLGLRAGAYTPEFARKHMRSVPASEAHILRRWRALRDKWVAAGCPQPRPWDLLGRRA